MLIQNKRWHTFMIYIYICLSVCIYIYVKALHNILSQYHSLQLKKKCYPVFKLIEVCDNSMTSICYCMHFIIICQTGNHFRCCSIKDQNLSLVPVHCEWFNKDILLAFSLIEILLKTSIKYKQDDSKEKLSLAFDEIS